MVMRYINSYTFLSGVILLEDMCITQFFSLRAQYVSSFVLADYDYSEMLIESGLTCTPGFGHRGHK